MNLTRGLLLLSFIATWAERPAMARTAVPRDPRKNVTIEPRIGIQLPLSAAFRDELGRAVNLADYFGERPVLLTPVYYRCPQLCGLELKGLVRALRVLELIPGRDFEIVTFSIDPRETPDLARAKKQALLAEYGRAEAAKGWHFLTGDAEPVAALCEALGFRAAYDSITGQYAHAAGMMVASPGGVLTHYLYGIEVSPRDLRLSIVDASQNRVGTLTDRVLLYCYMYDPTRGKYALAIMNLLRAGGLITVAALLGGIGRQLLNERRRNAAVRLSSDSHHGQEHT